MKIIKYAKAVIWTLKQRNGFQRLIDRVRSRMIVTDQSFAFSLVPPSFKGTDVYPEHLKFSEAEQSLARSHNDRQRSARHNYKGDIKIAWFIPDFETGGGGHFNFFRCQKYLKNKFNISSANVLYSGGYSRKNPKELAKIYERKAEGIFGADYSGTPFLQSEAELEDYKVLMATTWASVYGVIRRKHPLFRSYFIQDYEPYFYGEGGRKLYAENSYEFGLYPVCAGPWLPKQLDLDRKNIPYVSYNLTSEAKNYFPDPSVSQKEGICFYVRNITDRRGFELAVGTMLYLKEKRPDIEIYTVGMDAGDISWLDFCKHYGMKGIHELGKIYSSHRIYAVFSFTNYSLLPAEIMACGGSVVDLDLPNNRAVKNLFPEALYHLSEPNPERVAEKILSLYDKNANPVPVSNLKLFTSWEEEYSKIGFSLLNEFGRSGSNLEKK